MIIERLGDRGVNHEADHYFESIGHFDGRLLEQAHAQCFERFRRDIKNDEIEMVVVSNTFCLRKHIQPYIEECVAAGIIPQIVKCTGMFQSVHNVPAATIEKMRQQWEEI